MKTLLLGLGNPLRRDDGVGIYVVRRLKDQIKGIDISETYSSGLDLLEIIKGYDRVFIVDAMRTGKYKVGKLCKFDIKNFNCPDSLSSSHTFDLTTLIQLGQRITPDEMPKEIIVYGIEVADVTAFSEGLSQRLQKELPSTINRLKREIESYETTDPGNSET